MAHTNGDWSEHLPGEFRSSAAALEISRGMHPAYSYEARDPWHRHMPHNARVWERTDSGWGTTVTAPTGHRVRLFVART